MKKNCQHTHNDRKAKDISLAKTPTTNITRTDPIEAIPPTGEMTLPKQRPIEYQETNVPKRRKYDETPKPTASTTTAAYSPKNEMNLPQPPNTATLCSIQGRHYDVPEPGPAAQICGMSPHTSGDSMKLRTTHTIIMNESDHCRRHKKNCQDSMTEPMMKQTDTNASVQDDVSLDQADDDMVTTTR